METRLSPNASPQVESTKTKAQRHVQSFSCEIVDYLRAVSKLSNFNYSIVQVFNAAPEQGQLFVNLAGMGAKFAHIESPQAAYINDDVLAHLHKFFRTWRSTDLIRAKKFIKKLFAPVLASKEWDAYMHDPYLWQHHPAFKAKTLQTQCATAFALKLVAVYRLQQPNVPEHVFVAFTQVCTAMLQRQCLYEEALSELIDKESSKILQGLNNVHAQAMLKAFPARITTLKEHILNLYHGKVKAKHFTRIFKHALIGFCEKLIAHRLRLLVNAAMDGTYKLKHIENDVLHLSLTIDEILRQNRVVLSSAQHNETLSNYDTLMQNMRQQLMTDAFKQVIHDVQAKMLKEEKLPGLFEKMIDRVLRVLQTPAACELFLLSLVRHVNQLQPMLKKQEVTAALAKVSLIAIKNTYQKGLVPVSIRPAIAALVALMDPKDKDLIRWRHQHALLFVGVHTSQFFNHAAQQSHVEGTSDNAMFIQPKRS